MRLARLLRGAVVWPGCGRAGGEQGGCASRGCCAVCRGLARLLAVRRMAAPPADASHRSPGPRGPCRALAAGVYRPEMVPGKSARGAVCAVPAADARVTRRTPGRRPPQQFAAPGQFRGGRASRSPLAWPHAQARRPGDLRGGRAHVRVSSPDKVYFPQRGITKRQVVEYYLAVAEPLLRAMRRAADDAEALRRTASTGESFYAKRVPKGAPDWVETARITFPSRPHGRRGVPDGARRCSRGRPTSARSTSTRGRSAARRRPPGRAADRPRPAARHGFADAVRWPRSLREVLDDAGLTGYPKTSGGRGIHVLVADPAGVGLHRRCGTR